MEKEKIAAIALIVIIAGSLSLYLIATNQDYLFKNLFPEDGTIPTGGNVIAEGDCIDLHYIGRYASNDTVFDSSYEFIDNKTGGNPLKIFVTLDKEKTPPSEYSQYSSSIIDGLMEQLEGLELGESYILDSIPPEEAYGMVFDVGDTVDSTVFNQNIIHFTSFINQTLQVIEKTDDNIKMQWINPPDASFTLPSIIIFGSLDLMNPNPSYDDVLKISPPFAIWKNATEIIETTEDYYITKTTPTSLENLTENITQVPLDLLGGETLFIIPDATSVTYNESFITFHLDPEVGKIYKYAEQSIYGEINIELTINDVTLDRVNLSVFIVEYNQSQDYDLERVKQFNRTFEFPRIYDMDLSFLQQALPQFESDLQREGYSLSELAGETLIFEVTVEDIIKTSQKDN